MELTKNDRSFIKELAKIQKKDNLSTSFYISIQEATIILRMHQEKIKKLIEYGALKAIDTGKSVKILKGSLDELHNKLADAEFPNNFKDKRITNIFKPYN